MYYSILIILSIVTLSFGVIYSKTVTNDELSKSLGIPLEGIKLKMEKVFRLVDIDQDGSINKTEAALFVVRLNHNVNDAAMRLEIETLDLNKDGVITLAEILSSYDTDVDSQDRLAVDETKKRFVVVDKDKNGELTPEEVSLLMTPGKDSELTRLEIADIIKAHDKNGDDLISLAEYLAETVDATPEEKKHLEDDFKTYDTNHDGYVDAHELNDTLFQSLDDPNKQADEMWADLVGDDNKKVSLEDMLNHLALWATSRLTDVGELLRFPESYKLGTVFNNLSGSPDSKLLPDDLSDELDDDAMSEDRSDELDLDDDNFDSESDDLPREHEDIHEKTLNSIERDEL